MSQEKSDALVLRGVDFSETSRILTLLSPQRGRLACMAKGARRKNSAFGPVLDTLNRIEAVYLWKDGRQVQTLTEASLLNGFPGIKGDLERSAFAAFPLELAAKVAHENEPSEALYDTLLRGMECLDQWPGDARAHVVWQVFQLMAAAGFAPALDHCARCGGAMEGRLGFSFEGGLTCGRCPADRTLSTEQQQTLRQLNEAEDHCPPVNDSAWLFQLARNYAARQLDADFRSVRVLNELFP